MGLRSERSKYLVLASAFAVIVVGCSKEATTTTVPEEAQSNILLQEWDTDFAMPPYGAIPADAYAEAYDIAATMQNDDIAKIVKNADEPTFENTIEPYERSRSMLYRVLRTFLPINHAAKDEVIGEAASHIFPAFAAHEKAIFLNKDIYDRVDAIFRTRNNRGLRRDQIRLVELIHQEFMKSGIGVSEKQKPRLEAIAAEIASLRQQFSDNITKESSRYELLINDREDLGRMPETLVGTAATRAKEKGHDCECWSFSVKEAEVDSFLQYSPNRALRKQLYNDYMSVGSNENEYNNSEILKRILEVRAQQANIMGFATYADYKTRFAMAETPGNAERLVNDVYTAAVEAAMKDKVLLEKAGRVDGIEGEIEAWDWPYYAEAARLTQYSVSDEQLRPYFSLENVQEGAFALANRLFGLGFKRRDDLPRWDADQAVFEVIDREGKHLGVLMIDYFSRDNKRNGAWTDEVRVAEKMDGDVTAISSLNFRIAKPSGETPALLSLFEAETIFHEFGHALHTLLSTQTYVRLSGFNYLPRDGAEYPSQVMEYWFNSPEYMRTFAKHYETGEPIGDELMETIARSSQFNLGNGFVKTAASSLLDLRLHSIESGTTVDAGAIEDAVKEALELPDAIGWRYRGNNFRHIVSLGYPAGFYGYLYSDVLAADAFGEFEENGLFDAETANRFRKLVFEIGAGEPPLKMFREFRGRDPSPAALLSTIGD